MLVPADRVMEAILFTAVAYLIPIVLTWWLFGSRLSGPARRAATPSLRESAWLGGLLGYSGLQMLIGGHWDASKHIQTGQIPSGADFLWAPHIMIYSSFLISLGVAVFSVVSIARDGWAAGDRDPRRWVRANPILGAVAMASVYSLLSVPGDAIWHEIFGVDLTAWSPPHVMLGLTSVTVTLCGAAMLAKARDGFRKPAWVNAGIYLMLAIGVQMAHLIGTSEWEFAAEQSPLVAARPIWLYPVVSGALTLAFLMVGRAIIGSRWSATIVALSDIGLRGALMLGLGISGNLAPLMPLLAVVGAVLMDVVQSRQQNGSLLGVAAGAGAFTAGFAALALPWIFRRAELHFGGLDSVITILVTLVLAMVLIPGGLWFGNVLTGKGSSQSRPTFTA